MKTPTLYCGDGLEIELPFKWTICSACRGEGRSSAYLGAYTSEDMDAAGPEFQEEYMAGRYDRPCEPCDGTGKVKVADYPKMTKEQRAAYTSQRKADREIAAEEAAERRFGC